MCSTIRPLTLDHCFAFFQGTHVWKALTGTFHPSLVLLRMVASASRSKGRKCARLSSPSLWASVLVSFKGPMYGKPKPIAFTRALFCQEWLHQFGDPRVQTVLDYPSPHFGPLFWFLSRDPCMESTNQYLSPEPCFARNGCISCEIQGSKVCSTIRPLTLGHCFGFFQGTHVGKAPTSTFHQSLVLPRRVASISRSKGLNCAGLSVPSLWATVLVFFKGPMYGKPLVPFTRALFCQEWLHHVRDPRVESVPDYPPPRFGQRFWFLSRDRCMESPNQHLSAKPCFAGNGCINFRDPRVKTVLDYPPPHSGPVFWFVSRDPCMESPKQYLSPEPCFARNGCIGSEIQGSKVCSTIRPLTLGHCLGLFHGTHVWKAPTSAFHQSLVLLGMVASVSTSKGPNCARLSAPSLWATILVSFKKRMYGKPQPVPFTRALFCHK